LRIESLQDISSSSFSSAGGSIGINFNPLTGGLGGSLSVNGGAGSGSSAWVNEQSGIFAENGIDVSVGGNTALVGGAIVSENGEITLDTGTLTFQIWPTITRPPMSRAVSASVSVSTSRARRAGASLARQKATTSNRRPVPR
jgi:hypothetical protein